MTRTYTCAQCHGTFRTDPNWSEEDALAEAETHGFDIAASVMVCDDCFGQIMAYNEHPIGERKP